MFLQFYLCAFFSGLFLTNAIPHFMEGISGNKFPTPFAKPPGRGLSSPIVNVLWGVLNAIIGTILFVHSAIKAETTWLWVTFFVGVTLMGVLLSIGFSKKQKE
ncbi:MAG TPA: hypothetical protein VGQ51_17265 [Puia sp.]|jgi:hypothetical protein|nr:hypothetical protein [Puia sp.]